MPAKPGKSAKDIDLAYSNFVGRMTGPKTKAAMAKMLSVGMSNAKQFAPVEYGVLVNSAFHRIEGSKGNWRGVGGFMANYAVYLNGTSTYTPLWKPRPPEDKDGNDWNPFATPRFLELGFTGPIALPQMEAILKSEMKI